MYQTADLDSYPGEDVTRNSVKWTDPLHALRCQLGWRAVSAQRPAPTSFPERNSLRRVVTLLTLLGLLFLPETVEGGRAIPDDNLAYPVLVEWAAGFAS